MHGLQSKIFVSIEIDTVDVSASGDLSYVRVHSQITKNKLNFTTPVNTKFIDIWKKIDVNGSAF